MDELDDAAVINFKNKRYSECSTSVSVSASNSTDLWKSQYASLFSDSPNDKPTDWCAYLTVAELIGLDMEKPQSEVNQDRRVLDVGCGKGAFSAFMKDCLNVGVVHGVDVKECPRVTYTLWDEPPPQFFDTVVCCFVMGVFKKKSSIQKILSKAHEMLQPGGCCAVVVNNPKEMGRRFSGIQDLPMDSSDSFSPPSASSLEALDDAVVLQDETKVSLNFFSLASGGLSPPAARTSPSSPSRLRFDFRRNSDEPYISAFEYVYTADSLEQLSLDVGFKSVSSVTPVLSSAPHVDRWLHLLGIPACAVSVERQYASALIALAIK
eukprot:Platyproteum_vivax@DN6160_c0_g1_i2.p1